MKKTSQICLERKDENFDSTGKTFHLLSLAYKILVSSSHSKGNIRLTSTDANIYLNRPSMEIGNKYSFWVRVTIPWIRTFRAICGFESKDKN